MRTNSARATCARKSNPLVSLIIPFFNQVEMTRRCLKSVLSSTFGCECGKGMLYEIILVDDCSEEAFFFADEFQGSLFQVIRNERNLGFARSCNRGAKEARGRYLVFLNNDTVALQGWLEQLVRTIEEDPAVGIVGAKLLYGDETVQHAGIVFDEDKLPFHLYRHFPSMFSGVNKRREFQAVTGACFIIASDLFRMLGGFDERYVNGFEDIDLCLRVREAGRKVVYSPESCLYHFAYGTRSFRAELQESNLALFHKRWSDKVVTDYHLYYQEDFSEGLPDALFALRKAASSVRRPVLAIWGAGRGGRQAAKLLRYIGVEQNCFIDSSEKKWGSYVEGLPVREPQYLEKLRKQGRTVFVIVASTWCNEIVQQLTEMGFRPGEHFVLL